VDFCRLARDKIEVYPFHVGYETWECLGCDAEGHCRTWGLRSDGLMRNMYGAVTWEDLDSKNLLG
jgi:hypothetical protein